MIQPSQFEALFRQNTHWIDVRSPIEFQDGAVPGAINLPLLSDSERHEIGIIYKVKGQQAAIELGHQLVTGPVKDARLQAWAEESRQNPQSIIYCFRGGLRSQITQLWLKEIGIDCPIVAGGYKALRRFLLSTLESRSRSLSFRVVSGPTGSGKTKYLRKSGRPFLDLEALAKHRGSAFGALEQPQPSQADFENAIALALLRLPEGTREVLIEDESRMVGKLSIPDALFTRMKSSPREPLDLPIEQRVENIFQEYILESRLGKTGDSGKFLEWKNSVNCVSRKLGGLLTQEILKDIEYAEREYFEGKGLEANRAWIRKLLEKYYDPLYARWKKSHE